MKFLIQPIRVHPWPTRVRLVLQLTPHSGDIHRRHASYRQMSRSRPIRLAAVTCISAAALVHAQSRSASQHPSTTAPVTSVLPATQPTQTPPPLPPTPAQLPAQHARVTYSDDKLTVSASNSSLNQILREISHQTGIKITGGVADERVFGEYGPAAASQVLASLLDGTASNMVLVQSTTSAPAELILTPRMGGPTPPNPNAARFDDNEPEEPPSRPAPEAVQPNPPQTQPPQPAATPATSSTPVQNNPETAAPTPPPADSTQQQSPNGVKTPQQIYDELMRLRQQQQSNPPK
ncbi:hypothetical protein EDE15_5057 [Edaphobacter aggregans]|jgi:hypothetical protein|uniref:Uncharacterized protein n=2 Tax=Edaphobacter aggregans TaxID=570835 RepID=A0A428MR59_9BACT|nr:hypothetical protein EDE15_5057 [Edaphobacter aggregans]